MWLSSGALIQEGEFLMHMKSQGTYCWNHVRTQFGWMSKIFFFFISLTSQLSLSVFSLLGNSCPFLMTKPKHKILIDAQRFTPSFVSFIHPYFSSHYNWLWCFVWMSIFFLTMGTSYDQRSCLSHFCLLIVCWDFGTIKIQ